MILFYVHSLSCAYLSGTFVEYWIMCVRCVVISHLGGLKPVQEQCGKVN